jgi:hypothetical protein
MKVLHFIVLVLSVVSTAAMVEGGQEVSLLTLTRNATATRAFLFCNLFNVLTTSTCLLLLVIC